METDKTPSLQKHKPEPIKTPPVFNLKTMKSAFKMLKGIKGHL